MNETQQRSKEVAIEIYRQIGRKAMYMIGAKNCSYFENALVFQIRGSRRVSAIKVQLTSMDLYDITFFKFTKTDPKTVAEHKGVYDDMLRLLIEKETGLRTHL